MKPIARSGGRSAVAAIAYRTASRLLNERDGLVHDFTAKRGMEHSEIVLPDGVEADWALDRSTLWNAAERAEKRSDSRVAREFEIALPHELNREQQIALTRVFAKDLANRYGAAVDFAIHRPSGETDIRNVHAHVVMTTRQVGSDGLGEKTLIERENKWLLNNDQPTSHMQLKEIRQAWEHHANRELMQAGLDIRIDHRAHLDRGLEIEPTEHMGVHASQMERRGLDVSRARHELEAGRKNAELIRRKPEQVLTLITAEKSVFDRHDVARALHRYIDDVQAFQNAFAAVMASPALVELRPEDDGNLARYSTQEMVQVEHDMASRAMAMQTTRNHGVDPRNVATALAGQDDAIKASVAAGLTAAGASGKISEADRSAQIAHAGLSDEQRLGVDHITGPEQITAVIGFAGAGKSTMLAAARQAWESQGYRVHGAALAGKAAEGLEESSGIASRTLASWSYSWERGRGQLSRDDIFVIDEAGMVSSRQLASVVAKVQESGAKLVLVGDHEQLQAIGAGSPFRAIVERIGAVELSEIRRQKEAWQREASTSFATHRTGEGLAQYAERGNVHFLDDREAARADLVRDYLADLETRPSGSRIALAHRRVDVRAINADIREALQERGKLAKGQDAAGELGRERTYTTNAGERAFAPGDRIVLLENNRDLGVKNGMLGTVLAVEADALQIRLDGGGRNGARAITIPASSYQAFDHGYATTIHKSQGATVDRAFVLASGRMDRHLTYVAMTRHREEVRLYAGRDAFKDLKTLSVGLGQSGAKETTLDYTRAFAERRGIAEAFGISSEIAVNRVGAAPMDRLQSTRIGPEHLHAQLPPAGEGGDRPVEKIAPLVPAITTYSKSVEDIAREKARPDLDRAMDPVRSVGRQVFVDPEGVAAKVSATIMRGGSESGKLAKSMSERPERFGELLGKTGMLGDNKERRSARHFTNAFGNHVASAVETWERRLMAERESETWKREKRDVVEVPGLSARSETLLKQLDGMAQAEKPKFLEELAKTPDGTAALDEAKSVARALEQRFGTADLRRAGIDEMRIGPESVRNLDQIRQVARIVDLAQRSELSRQYELKRNLSKGLSLGL